MQYLAKQELTEKLEEIELFPELKNELDKYLFNYIHNKDLEIIEKLLHSGASPNSTEETNDYLLLLHHEYEAEKNTNGQLILSIMETLLINGANPNRVVTNNLRAYDYAVAHKTTKVVELLKKYGVNLELREAI